jgi:hypothetical protein
MDACGEMSSDDSRKKRPLEEMAEVISREDLYALVWSDVAREIRSAIATLGRADDAFRVAGFYRSRC